MVMMSGSSSCLIQFLSSNIASRSVTVGDFVVVEVAGFLGGSYWLYLLLRSLIALFFLWWITKVVCAALLEEELRAEADGWKC
jgi:hypothetical protein